MKKRHIVLTITRISPRWLTLSKFDVMPSGVFAANIRGICVELSILPALWNCNLLRVMLLRTRGLGAKYILSLHTRNRGLTTRGYMSLAAERNPRLASGYLTYAQNSSNVNLLCASPPDLLKDADAETPCSVTELQEENGLHVERRDDNTDSLHNLRIRTSR